MHVCRKPSIMPRRFGRWWIFAGLAVTACSTGPADNRAQFELKAKPAAPRLSQPDAPVKSYGLADGQAFERLLNADALLQAGDIDAAQKQLDLLRQAELSPEQRGKYTVLAAQIDLSMGDAEQALYRLKTVRPLLLEEADRISYYRSLAFGYSLTGNVLQAVSSRIRLGNLLREPKQQQDNVRAIVETLASLPDDEAAVAPELSAELQGWMALAKILKLSRQTGTDSAAAINQWRADYPGHAANAEFLQAYLTSPPTVTPADSASGHEPLAPVAIPAIAVLLPTSGPYAPAGKAIKEGMLAAYRAEIVGGATAVPLKFYDSGQEDVVQLYRQAVTDGAKHVVGPLVKEQIETLAANAELSVPVLALNHVDNLQHDNLYQFGLSPIDEAQAVARKARRDGKQRVLILVPNTGQGQRVGNYLTAAWQAQGGTVAGMQSYDPRLHDIGAVLERLLETVNHPGAPQGVEALLLSANADAARELAVQLKYRQAGGFTVYAMPTIYSGRPDPGKDAELGAFDFCDIPWLFDNYYQGPVSRASLQSHLQGLPDGLDRLAALGVDAYYLLSLLPQLAVQPYAGATGKLGLNAENRVTRTLVCAQFTGGVPVPNGYAD